MIPRVILLLSLGALLIGGCAGTSEEWTGSGRVCDYKGDCSDEFKCRSADGRVEIYLPYGSFGRGNEGWEWEEDVGGRCGNVPA